jgi:type I restriction enzyme M protein
MSPETHKQIADFIWSICNRLRGPYKRNEYRTVILAPTKAAVLKQAASLKGKPIGVSPCR